MFLILYTIMTLAFARVSKQQKTFLHPLVQGLAGMESLTSGNNDPRSIASDEVPPKVLRFRAAVRGAVELALGEAGRVVERHAVKMRHAHDDLERVAETAGAGDREGGREAERAPYCLHALLNVLLDNPKARQAWGELTTVMASTQITNGSDVR